VCMQKEKEARGGFGLGLDPSICVGSISQVWVCLGSEKRKGQLEVSLFHWGGSVFLSASIYLSFCFLSFFGVVGGAVF